MDNTKILDSISSAIVRLKVGANNLSDAVEDGATFLIPKVEMLEEIISELTKLKEKFKIDPEELKLLTARFEALASDEKDWDKLVEWLEKNKAPAGLDDTVDLIAQVWNGGFEQYLHNGFGPGFGLALEYLEALGTLSAADISLMLKINTHIEEAIEALEEAGEEADEDFDFDRSFPDFAKLEKIISDKGHLIASDIVKKLKI